MHHRVVECVPNFSEGRDPAKIKKITDAIESVSGTQLLNVEMGADTNRTVVTFTATPEAVGEAAFCAIQMASQVIDMSKHQGEHPRMGATDVCPFIPVNGVSMQDCIKIAQVLGERVGRELQIPVFLYEEASSRPERKNLADIRRGEYEGLKKKLEDPAWKPDFGPTLFNARSGATVIGAREFLIAYNITLNTVDKQIASEIAYEIREKGRVARKPNSSPYYFKGTKLFYQDGEFPCGSCEWIGKSFSETRSHCKNIHQYDLDALLLANEVDPGHPIGKSVYRPGKFNFCKAIGWYVDEYKRAQISINLTHYKTTPPHLVLEEVRQLALARGLVVTGSEVVGLIPYPALLEAGKYYLNRQGASAGIPAGDILRTAVFSMGLNDVSPFEIEKKVIGIPQMSENALVAKTVHEFVNEVSRPSPAPGGGSIAALAGSIGAALASMVANLTHGKEGTERVDSALSKIAEKAQAIKDKLLWGVDADTNAFNDYMTARRLPKTTPEEKTIREQKMQEGLKIAIQVPWGTAELSFEAMELAREVANIGNPNSITDAAVGVQVGFAGVRGGIYNVLINLKEITDPTYATEMKKNCINLQNKAQKLLEESTRFVDQKLGWSPDGKH